MAIREHTIYDCILRNACNHSDKTALVSGDLFLTFADVPIHVNSLARGLLNTGYEKGDRIAVLLNNCAEYALLLAACTRIGVIAVCLNTRTNADEMRMLDGRPSFLSNNAGGILGGISTGQDIIARFVVKPTSSIITPRQTITTSGENAEVSTKGRHDPCVGIRGVPVGEAMIACVLADHLLLHKTQCR